MGVFTLGNLTTVPTADRPDLVASPTWEALVTAGLTGSVGVVEIDPTLSDTAASQAAYSLPPESLVNCVVVGGRRAGDERIAACLVRFTTRADVNGTVKRRLDVRKASFLPMDRAVELTGMEYGGINPIGLPGMWPILVDAPIADQSLVLIGSGVRHSKLILPGALLVALPRAEAVTGLGLLERS